LIPILALCSTTLGWGQVNCPEGWTSAVFSPNCFKIVTGNQKSWNAAKEFCEDLDAKLFFSVDFF